MTAEWCTEVLEQAIEVHGKPEIFNSDQGSQFTSEVVADPVIAAVDDGLVEVFYQVAVGIDRTASNRAC